MDRRNFMLQSFAFSLGASTLYLPAAIAQEEAQKKGSPLIKKSQQPGGDQPDGPRDPGDQDPEMSRRFFPELAETEFERSVIRVPLFRPSNTSSAPEDADELVELRAYMRLERKPPVTNRLGYRQFEFTIRNWELFGYSALYDANITFTASEADPGEPEVVQPRSICVALTRPDPRRPEEYSDYPAMIHYNAIYDIFLDSKRIVRKMPGVAMATGVMQIPPHNVTVAFQKPFKSQDINLGAGTCEDMQPISKQEFVAGRGVGVGIRRGELDLSDDRKSQLREGLRPVIQQRDDAARKEAARRAANP